MHIINVTLSNRELGEKRQDQRKNPNKVKLDG